MTELKIGFGVSTVDQDLTAQCDALAGCGIVPNRVYVDRGLIPRCTTHALQEVAMVRGA